MKRKRQGPIKLSQLQILMTVADRSSFSEAALCLGLSQSAVSCAIASLESDLGVLLLMRGHQGASLTPIGERIVGYTHQMMELESKIIKEANLAKGLEKGQVRIATFRSISTHVLPKVISQFYHRFPDLSIKLREHSDEFGVEEDLRRGYSDVGFTDQQLSKEFESWATIQDEYLVLLPPSSKTQLCLNWESLSTYPMIFSSEGDSCDENVIEHCSIYGATLQIAYRVKSDSAIVSMVAQALGASIMPRLVAEPIPSNILTHSLPVALYRNIQMITLANMPHPPAVFAFLDAFKEIYPKICTSLGEISVK